MSRRLPGRRAEYALFSVITTRWFDNDIYGHMNNAMHYQLFDTAVNGMLIKQGLLDLKDSPTVFLVVETGCTYHSEIAFPDTVNAGLRVGRIGSSSIRYELGLFRNDEESAAAEGHFVHVNVDRQSRKPAAISDKARGEFKALMRGSA